MTKKLPLLICFFLIQISFGQVTFVIDSIPENTPKNSDIYITGDFEGWTGGQEKFKLEKRSGKHSITIPKQVKSIHFKFTQGSWDSVEVDKNGKSIANRTHTFVAVPDDVEPVIIKIQNWSQAKELPSTASKNVSILSEDFFIPQLNRTRKIWLYLPPDYKTSNKDYPVIYMHDGQNLFDDTSSFSGEWQVDETLDKLYEENGFSAIVIGIENGGVKRLDEYSPWENEKYGGGEGEKYIQFIAETLKPFVDENYRTKSDKENTAIIGSSMGGLISFYAVLKYNTTFGLGGIYSPSFWFSEKSFEFAKINGNLDTTKFYFLAGAAEDDNETFEGISKTSQDLYKMDTIIKAQGFNKKNSIIKVVPGGKHNEKLWRENFEEAIRWLFTVK
ncbi:MAG: alpha/beta hydrolase-fold protein [Urechidicola sp.]|nr:alpha/beta hydrolase-fold protein [Urechidicola sp.]